MHRQVGWRCQSSLFAVFTVYRIGTMPTQPAHGDLQGLAWCPTPPSSLSSKGLAAGGIYLTLQPRADTYRTSSYKLRCDTLQAGALQRRAVCCRGEYVNEFATGVGHIGRPNGGARSNVAIDRSAATCKNHPTDLIGVRSVGRGTLALFPVQNVGMN